MTLENEIFRRGITEVLHFTTHRGLVGTLAAKQLKSRKLLTGDEYLEKILYPNSASRPEASEIFDKTEDWIDYVNLSFSEINSRFFNVSEGWHIKGDIWWVILSFDPIIATHEGVYFATTNNKYDLCRRALSEGGFNALFEPVVGRLSASGWHARRGGREDRLPTCEQAELLYPRSVPAEFLRTIYVREAQDYDRVRGWLNELGFPHVQVVQNPAKFVGKQN